MTDREKKLEDIQANIHNCLDEASGHADRLNDILGTDDLTQEETELLDLWDKHIRHFPVFRDCLPLSAAYQFKQKMDDMVRLVYKLV